MTRKDVLNKFMVGSDGSLVFFVMGLFENSNLFEDVIYCYENYLIDNWFFEYFFHNHELRSNDESKKDVITMIMMMVENHKKRSNTFLFVNDEKLMMDRDISFVELSPYITKLISIKTSFNDICIDIKNPHTFVGVEISNENIIRYIPYLSSTPIEDDITLIEESILMCDNEHDMIRLMIQGSFIYELNYNLSSVPEKEIIKKRDTNVLENFLTTNNIITYT